MSDEIVKTNDRQENLPTQEWEVLSPHEKALVEELNKGGNKKYTRFVLAVLGSISWVGGVLGAIAALDAEKDQEKITELQRLWLQEHQSKIKELGLTIQEVLTRLDSFGEEVQKRIESPDYLTLVRKSFRSWDQADTQGKRDMFKKLITNAGAITLCPDDLVRLFIAWIEQYHESHFAVIKEIYQKQSVTRGAIWDNIRGQRPRENSAEADLFRFLIRDLSTGGVIRQHREVDYDGNFISKTPQRRPKGSGPKPMTSAFDDEDAYELTELGKQFVHYVMEDVVPQIGDIKR